jgi:hypothetical protein
MRIATFGAWRHLPRRPGGSGAAARMAADEADMDHRQSGIAPDGAHRWRGVYHRGQAGRTRGAARSARAAARPPLRRAAAHAAVVSRESGLECGAGGHPAGIRQGARAGAAVALHQRADRAALARARPRQLPRLPRGTGDRRPRPALGCSAAACGARLCAEPHSRLAADAAHQPLLQSLAPQLAAAVVRGATACG